MMSNVIHAKEAEFNELIQKEELVLVDFFATWCGPCKMLAPEIEKLADELEGKAKTLKVDVDQEQALAMRYGVQSIPTLIVFKNGVQSIPTLIVFKNGGQTEKRLGYQPYPKLKEMLNR